MKKVMLSIILLLWPAVTAAALSTAEIQVTGEHKYKAVRLTPAIYNIAKPDLSDILVLDGQGEAVPYFINSFETISVSEAEKAIPLIFAGSFVKNGDYYADYFTESDEGRDIQATKISVKAMGGMFAKNVELRGSYDGIMWDMVKTDTLYKVDENEKLAINFDSPLKYTYYRFRIIDNAENISFDNVKLLFNSDTVNRTFYVEELEPEFETETKDKSTIIRLYGLKNIKLNEVTLKTEARFKRTAKYAYREKTLYNLSLDNSQYKDTTMEFDGYKNTEDVLEIEIDNGDDKPIDISGVLLTYYTDDVIFEGDNGSKYTLSFGDENKLAAPVYDISSYKDLVLKEGYDMLAAENIKMADKQPTKPERDYSLIFNVVVTVVSLILGFIILVRLRGSARS